MNKIYKFFERLSRLFRCLISNDYKSNHKYQNKNQVTNAELVLNQLKMKNYNPEYVLDIGCGYGQWTKKLLKFYPTAKYLLFDADKNNIKKNPKNINVKKKIKCGIYYKLNQSYY